jgi:hypothetical protein
MVTSRLQFTLNVNELAGLYAGDSDQQRRKDRTIGRNLVARHVGDDDSQAEISEVMLAFQFTVDGDKDIKRVLRVGQQRSVFAAAPANFADGFDRVAGERGFDSGIDAFI